ncbi:MAG: hypothetical protein CYPHOPRED_005862 [Cyphobasidiales sp. Tagirdzhanova-0007]|nr:MAG: hypothetical protein CYPHOPRED_005862 [Cyphobasidiales sp. Tagirdzhanova-0007]
MPAPSRSRPASHAGSWYSAGASKLDRELSSWLAQVSHPAESPLDPDDAIHPFPVTGAKAIIAPHAGYSYSGPTAAWAYKAIDTTSVNRVFILGPSHHAYLDGCALTACDSYATPLGDLPVDLQTNKELEATGKFSSMSQGVDEEEHSIEMHLPYLRKTFENKDIKVVPILVGSLSTSKEAAYGKLLAPFLADPHTFFVVSSDFCHWGTRFSYTYYQSPSNPSGTSLSRSNTPSSMSSYPIHASIQAVDHEGMSHIALSPSSPDTATQAHAAFAAYLKRTKNTICGRHPIGVLLAAVAALQTEGEKWWERECVYLKWTRYDQSSSCEKIGDSSVSYASAYLKLEP